MAARETPEAWKLALERSHIGSLRQLATKAGLSPTTLTNTVHGKSVPSDETVAALSSALGVSLSEVYSLVGQDMRHAEPYVPPPEANRLTVRQRRAIDEMIRAIAAEREDDDDTGTQDQQKPRTREAHALDPGADRAEDGDAAQRTGAPMSGDDELARRRKPWKKNLPPQLSPEELAELERRQAEADATTDEEIATWAAHDGTYTPEADD